MLPPPSLDYILIATAIKMEVSDRDLQVASKRYNLIAEHIQRPGGALANYMGDALVYAQGSRAIGATIVDGSSDDRFDLDAILEFPTPAGWRPSRVLNELLSAIQGFPDVRKIVCSTRCVKLQFAFMHLDVTPMDPFAAPREERAGNMDSPGKCGEHQLRNQAVFYGKTGTDRRRSFGVKRCVWR